MAIEQSNQIEDRIPPGTIFSSTTDLDKFNVIPPSSSQKSSGMSLLGRLLCSVPCDATIPLVDMTSSSMSDADSSFQSLLQSLTFSLSTLSFSNTPASNPFLNPSPDDMARLRLKGGLERKTVTDSDDRDKKKRKKNISSSSSNTDPNPSSLSSSDLSPSIVDLLSSASQVLSSRYFSSFLQTSKKRKIVDEIRLGSIEAIHELHATVMKPRLEEFEKFYLERCQQAAENGDPIPVKDYSHQPLPNKSDEEPITPLPSYIYSNITTINLLPLSPTPSLLSSSLGRILYHFGRLPYEFIRANNWEEEPSYKKYNHVFYTNKYRIKLLHIPFPTHANTPLLSSYSRFLATLESDLLLLVVDGSSGAEFQYTTELAEYILMAQLRGVKDVILCVTKLDTGVQKWSEKRYTSLLANLISSFLKPMGFGLSHIHSIPISDENGENITFRTDPLLQSWYKGPTFLQLIDKIGKRETDQQCMLTLLEKPRFDNGTIQAQVQLQCGALLAQEPLSFYSPSVPAAFGPIHISNLIRLIPYDERDIAIYPDKEINNSVKKIEIESEPKEKKKLSKSEQKKQEQLSKKEYARKAYKNKEWKDRGEWEQYEEESKQDSIQYLPSSDTLLALLPPDRAVFTLDSIPALSVNEQDLLSMQLSGIDMVEQTKQVSKRVVEYLLQEAKSGDILFSPADSLKLVTSFRAELLCLSHWPNDLSLKSGSSCSLIPMIRLQSVLPTSIDYFDEICKYSELKTKNSFEALFQQLTSLGISVTVEKIVSILNKTNRSILKKKPEELKGPTHGYNNSSSSSPSSASLGWDLALLHFTCSPSLLGSTRTSSTMLSNFLLLHQQKLIGIGSIAQIIA